MTAQSPVFRWQLPSVMLLFMTLLLQGGCSALVSGQAEEQLPSASSIDQAEGATRQSSDKPSTLASSFLQVETIREALQATQANVTVARPLSNDTLFDRLWGEEITTAYSVIISFEEAQSTRSHAIIYEFDDEATALDAAAVIEGGGTAFRYTRADGTIAQEFLQHVVAGLDAYWWQVGRYLITFADTGTLPDARVVRIISEALNSVPIQPPPNDADHVYMRLMNRSGQNISSLSIQVNGQEIDYGMLPVGYQNGYRRVVEEVGEFEVRVQTSAGEYYTYRDSVGVTENQSLRPGYYTLLLDINNNQLQAAYFANTPSRWSDSDLLGRWYWVDAMLIEQLRSGEIQATPSIEFFDGPDPTLTHPGLQLTGHGPCNSLSAAYYVNQERTLIIDEMIQSLIGCQGRVGELEQLLFETLSGISYYGIEGDTLHLRSVADGQLIFSRHDPVLSWE